MDLSFTLPHGPKRSEGDLEYTFLLLTHTKKLLLVTFCDLTAETGVSFRTHGWNGADGTAGQTDRREG